MNAFKAGDVVRLKSGGPLMTAKHQSKQDPQDWYCEWFVAASGADAAKVMGHLFEANTIEKVK